MIDFSFVGDILNDKYSSPMGRTAEDVIIMFKFLLLKSYFKLSDRSLIERTMTDMLFKYFRGYNPEDTIIDSSLLTIFRRERLIDNDINLMRIYSERYKIEVKNAKIKNNYGYDKANACGNLRITM